MLIPQNTITETVITIVFIKEKIHITKRQTQRMKHDFQVVFTSIIT
jgi:hypothetical protein